VAREGGAVLTSYQEGLLDLETGFKGRRTELVTAADRAAEELVVGRLIAAVPGHGILAEEGVLTPVGQASAAAAEPLWIVDPLDGTTNFVHGLPFYAVAIALVVAGEPIVGVVHAPALDWTFTAVRGGGARRNGAPLQVSRTAELGAALLATGFSYNRSEPGADDNVTRMQRALHAARDVRRFGSAELDLCMCAAGQNDGYWEMYLKPYDVAAGALIVREAGGLVTDLDGGGDWLYGGHIAASNGLLHRSLLETVGGAPAA
jgi:myo-inositol-1(or 4)-monophosphatase